MKTTGFYVEMKKSAWARISCFLHGGRHYCMENNIPPLMERENTLYCQLYLMLTSSEEPSKMYFREISWKYSCSSLSGVCSKFLSRNLVTQIIQHEWMRMCVRKSLLMQATANGERREICQKECKDTRQVTAYRVPRQQGTLGWDIERSDSSYGFCCYKRTTTCRDGTNLVGLK